MKLLDRLRRPRFDPDPGVHDDELPACVAVHAHGPACAPRPSDVGCVYPLCDCPTSGPCQRR